MKLDTTQKIFIQFCIESGLPAPIPEFRFHPKRKWRNDYFFELNGVKVALEVQGGLFMHNGKGGRHNRATGYLGDMEKSNAMAIAGIFILQVIPQDLLKKSTVEMVNAIFSANEKINSND